MLNELICYAENKLEEAADQGEDIATIRYWVGYLDGLRAVKRDLNKLFVKGGEGDG